MSRVREAFIISLLQKRNCDLIFKGHFSFVVEEIIFFSQIEYLIKWDGYSYYSCSWENEDNLTIDLVR